MVYTEDMLRLSPTLLDKPVMSLRTGGQIATAIEPIINPNNLKIEGFYCQDRFESKKQLILLTQDIRDFLKQGFLVNDHEVLTDPKELVRLEPVLKLSFKLLGKPVFTANKQRLGKVNDYAIDDGSMFVHKIYVGQNLLKSFSGGQLSIDRNQIVEITNHKIVVQDLLQGIPASAPATAPVTS